MCLWGELLYFCRGLLVFGFWTGLLATPCVVQASEVQVSDVQVGDVQIFWKGLQYFFYQKNKNKNKNENANNIILLYYIAITFFL